ncbi:AI-2E family transporter [Ruthenibacterium lactatiformans]|uniref:AI-2E family transporter n=1 Tax=Ruthenibacterium lactatiformans TaxID=1550024 RepID=UPI003AB3EE8A
MEAKTKQNLIVTVVGVSLFAALMNFSAVLGFAGKIVNLILPVIAGGILALFINVPMNGIEKRLKRVCKNAKKPPSDKLIHVLSFILTLICVALVLVLVLTLLIPEIIRSSQSLYAQIEASIPRWIAYLNSDNAHMGLLEDWLADIDWEQILQSVSDGIDAIVVNVAGALSSTVSVVVTAAFALIIAIYISLGKERLCRHARKLVCAYLKPIHAENILRFCRLFRKSFANFLTGQCSEAVILGTLMFIAFSLFKLPYGSLVGVLTAICAIIPYVGAFISCSVSVFLVLLIDPMLAIRCLIVYLAVQFIENQFIYPRVVGSSVGLPPLYTLIAAMIGGKLFGIIGIIFFIPLAAVVIELVKQDAARRTSSRENPVM